MIPAIEANRRHASLGEIMRQVDIAGLFSVAAAVAAWGKDKDETLIGAAFKKSERKNLAYYEEALVNLGFAATRVSLKKLIVLLARDDVRWVDLNDVCAEIEGRLQDEAEDREFFSMTLREAEYFQNPRLGWEESILRFPEILLEPIN